MINSVMAKQLVGKLGLAIGKTSIDDLLMLRYKWGAADGMYHSYKHMINKCDYKGTKEELSSKESLVVGIIEESLNGIYDCDNCECDFRKSGLFEVRTCLRRSNIFVSSEGNVTRNTGESYQDKTFNNNKPIIYTCGNCENSIHDGLPVFLFLTRGMNEGVIYEYIMKYTPQFAKDCELLYNGRVSQQNKRPDDMYCYVSPDFGRMEIASEFLREAMTTRNGSNQMAGSSGVCANSIREATPVSPPPPINIIDEVQEF